MIQDISIDCLQIILSFSGPKEMSVLTLVSRECERMIKQCNFAWYEMYIRFLQKTNPDKERVCNYSDYRCFRDPTIPDCERKCVTLKTRAFNRNQLILQTSYQNKTLLQPLLFSIYNFMYEADNKTVKKYVETVSDITPVMMNYIQTFNKTMKYCINPECLKTKCIQPIAFETGVNYKLLYQTKFFEYAKQLQFTEKDDAVINELTQYDPNSQTLFELQRKKRITKLVSQL